MTTTAPLRFEELPWGTHLCHLHGRGGNVRSLMVPFFAAGLREGQRCVWVTGEPIRPSEAVDALRPHLPDVDERVARDQLLVVDYRQWYLESGRVDPRALLRRWYVELQSCLDAGWEGLRVSGTSGQIRLDEWPAILAYERAIHERIEGHRVIAMCGYAGSSPAAQMARVMSSHEGTLCPTEAGWDHLVTARAS